MNGQLNVGQLPKTTQNPPGKTFTFFRWLGGLTFFSQLPLSLVQRSLVQLTLVQLSLVQLSFIQLAIVPLAIAQFALVQTASAEIYIYQGPNGERLISDRPPADDNGSYRLVAKRDTMSNAGHILAKRPITSGGPRRFNQFISAAGNQYNVDPALIEAVIQVESAFDPNAVSKKGATGLMQLMKATAKQYKVKNRFNPKENIYAGVKHLRYLLNRFDGEIPLVLAAYNAGATTVDKYNGIPPYPETRRYVTKVLGYHNRYRQNRYGGR